MRVTFSTLLFCLLSLTGWSQGTDAIMLQFPKTDVRHVLAFYERLTTKPVFIALDLQALVTVQTAEPIPRAAALELIRTTLLERYGIEFRTTDRNETLAGWSRDPKYPRRSDEPMIDEERSALPKGRVRIVKPDERK